VGHLETPLSVVAVNVEFAAFRAEIGSQNCISERRPGPFENAYGE
jgi:hypothetical protein